MLDPKEVLSLISDADEALRKIAVKLMDGGAEMATFDAITASLRLMETEKRRLSAEIALKAQS